MAESVLPVIIGVLLGIAVSFFTDKWTEKRERRNRRDDLRLTLAVDVIDLIVENEAWMARRSSEAEVAPEDLQRKQIHISHRLKLLAPQTVNSAYRAYKQLVLQEGLGMGQRPRNPEDVVNARDRLIELMASNVTRR